MTAGGTLKLIIGPMYSGKTTELLHQINSYRSIGKRVMVINHTFDTTRYAAAGLSTHDDPTAGKCPECATVSALSEVSQDAALRQQLRDADMVCIEELQFFEGARDTVMHWVNDLHKHVVAAGLIADYRCEAFGDVTKLIAHADEIKHVKALCSECNDGTEGIFTQRLSRHRDQVAVGAAEMYRAVCRAHYLGGACARPTAAATHTCTLANPNGLTSQYNAE